MLVDFEQLKKDYPDWNWDEAETIAPDDLEAAADFLAGLLLLQAQQKGGPPV